MSRASFCGFRKHDLARFEFCTCRDNEHRTSCMTHYALGHAADQNVPHAGPSMRWNNNQIHISFCQIANLCDWRGFPDPNGMSYVRLRRNSAPKCRATASAYGIAASDGRGKSVVTKTRVSRIGRVCVRTRSTSRASDTLLVITIAMAWVGVRARFQIAVSAGDRATCRSHCRGKTSSVSLNQARKISCRRAARNLVTRPQE